MQIVCERCTTAGAAAASEVVDGQIRLRCGACGHWNALRVGPAVGAGPEAASEAFTVETAGEPAPRPDAAQLAVVELEPLEPASATSAPVALPPVKCPKCGHRQHDDVSCDKCGLTFALVADGRRPWEEYAPDQAPHIPEAARLWSEVTAAPRDAARHGRFVDFCRERGLLTFAAMRYRHHMADFPDDAVSQSYLDRVVRDATATVRAMPGGRDEFAGQVNRVRNALLVIVVGLCGVAVAFMIRLMMSQDGKIP